MKEPTDQTIHDALQGLKQRVREQTIAELYHKLKGKKMSMNTLADALNTYPMKVQRMIEKNTPKP